MESYNYILKAIFISAKTKQTFYILQKIRNIRQNQQRGRGVYVSGEDMATQTQQYQRRRWYNEVQATFTE